MINMLRSSYACSGMVSEENEQVRQFFIADVLTLIMEWIINKTTPQFEQRNSFKFQIIDVDECKRGKYVVSFDPLDGSSNIDCLVSIGS